MYEIYVQWKNKYRMKIDVRKMIKEIIWNLFTIAGYTINAFQDRYPLFEKD